MVDFKTDKYPSGQLAPSRAGVEVTPNDAVDLLEPARFLWIGVAGTIKVTLEGNGDGVRPIVSTTVACGPFPFVVRRVWLTGTSATQIVAAT